MWIGRGLSLEMKLSRDNLIHWKNAVVEMSSGPWSMEKVSALLDVWQ